MSVINLMLLGSLIERPMNAYEMKKEMERKNIQDWVKISTPSMYRNLVKLYQAGYVDGQVVKEGDMPEKTIYTINDKGRRQFQKLMKHYSTNSEWIYMDFTAFILNLHNLGRAPGKQMAEELLEQFDQRVKLLASLAWRTDNAEARAIVDLNRRMYDLFGEWLAEFIDNDLQ